MLKALTPLAAIAAITGLSLYAMHLGIDGISFALSVCVISGIAGFKARDLLSTIIKK